MSKPLSTYQIFVTTELYTSWETLIHRYIHIHHKLYGPFLWIGFNKVRAACRATLRTPSIFNYVVM